MKALILAGGMGTRLKPVTDTIAKHLIPVADKPILFYAIEKIRQAGIDEIGLVVSPGTDDCIKQAVGSGSKWNVKINCIIQHKPRGIAHAVKAARDFLADSPFLLFLGDNLIQCGIGQFIDEFNIHKPDALILLKEVDNPSAFGIAELDSCGKIKCVVEKPAKPSSNMALIGIYVFTSCIHKAIDRIRPSRRGELEITDAIQELLVMNKEVRSNIIQGWWLDVGTGEGILKANRNIMLECIKQDIRGNVDTESKITGRVEVKPGTEIINSHIEGPVIIAENCHISDAFIGPFVSLGAETILGKSCVKNSIIMTGCNIKMVDELKDSIIGGGSRVLGSSGIHHYSSLFIGGNSIVKL